MRNACDLTRHINEIVLVEDSDTDAALILRAVRRLRIANPVRHFKDGLQAMAHFNGLQRSANRELVRGVLLLDLKLPGMSGFEILERIQHSAALAGMLRIVLSQIDDTQSMKRAYDLGAHSYLVKPFLQDDFYEIIEAFPGYWAFLQRSPTLVTAG